jgi:hypothetical protein
MLKTEFLIIYLEGLKHLKKKKKKPKRDRNYNTTEKVRKKVEKMPHRWQTT